MALPQRNPMLIDTHCHLTYAGLVEDVPGVLARAAAAGVSRAITIATSPADARKAAPLLGAHANLCMAAGVHPHEAGKATDDDLAALRDLHAGLWNDGPPAARLAAVGETGLDFHYDFAPRTAQERVFRAQLELACAVGRPVVIHARKAEELVVDILREYAPLAGRAVFHCFSGDAALARRILDAGFWLSFTGVVTFRNSQAIQEAARLVPDDRFMVETDAPYLSPEPVRKQRPCEPALVAHTARFLAELRGVSFEALAAQTTENARRFFGIG